MKIIKQTIYFVSAVLLVASVITLSTATAAPAIAGPAGLSFVELKITGDEFVLLQNNSTAPITDLNSYWLTAYNNVNPLASGVSNSTQQLPAAVLMPGQTMLLSSGAMQTCGASVAGKLSVGLTDGGGYLQIVRSGMNDQGAVVQYAGDWVSWSNGATGLIQNLPSSTKDPRAAYYRYLNENGYAWQLADLDVNDACQLNIVVAGGSGSSSAVTPLTLAATSPPATILGIVGTGSSASAGPQMPAADIGLLAPQISELLPNPEGTGNDSTNEYIELYNPNTQPFDLTGFILQTGVTTTHEFVLPAGTMLPGNGFKAFYSEETKLSMSNTSSRANLFDPAGTVLSSSAVFSKAKDGIAWAVASGIWYWTTQPTPGAANVVKQPITASTTAKGKAAKLSPKGAKTAKAGASTTAAGFEESDTKTPIHSWVLALVAGGALLYGAYEYRRDLANRLFQLRAKLGARRTNRQPIKGGRSD